ncbi:MAG: hypothetical protein U0995_09650 [Erythrobacter sp.]|nr:hypothetical protein [Erythrobacter sp.]MDZ4273242.1 hypothetical protein [Erythrobacter sp.]MDZ4276292.1 hypothetical protein [Erythrobacter sp.]
MKFYPTITDQALHFAVALAIGLAFLMGGIIGGAIAGLACGLIRELTEAGGSRIALSEIGPHFAKRDPWIDLAFWTIGGAVAGWLA